MNFKIKSSLAILTLVVSGQLHAMPKFVEGSYTCKDSTGVEFLSSLTVRNNQVIFSGMGTAVPGYEGVPCLNEGNLKMQTPDVGADAVAPIFECNESHAFASMMVMHPLHGTMEGFSVML